MHCCRTSWIFTNRMSRLLIRHRHVISTWHFPSIPCLQNSLHLMVQLQTIYQNRNLVTKFLLSSRQLVKFADLPRPKHLQQERWRLNKIWYPVLRSTPDKMPTSTEPQTTFHQSERISDPTSNVHPPINTALFTVSWRRGVEEEKCFNRPRLKSPKDIALMVVKVYTGPL